MKRTYLFAIGAVCAAVSSASFLAATVNAQGIPILTTSDTAIAIDADAVFALNGRYPGAENPPKAIDGIVAGPPFSKYLNFGAAGSGFIVTPTAQPGTPVDGFQITTGNDAPGRDPAMWSLYGFNGTLITTDSGASPAINADGLAEAWTLIGSGGVTLPGDPAIGNDQRGVVGPMVAVNSITPYDHYKFIVDAIKRPSDNIMQFAEIQFFADDANPGSGFLSPTDPIIAVDEIKAWSGSSFPGGEAPRFAIDQSVNAMMVPNTKYLNFGEEKSGLIITNVEGPAQIVNMRLTTAGDFPVRDPASFELYGTNDPILSASNSDGIGGETYTLIASGPLSLPAARNDATTVVPINASAAFSSFKLIFPTVKDAAAANSMQIADVQLYAVPEPGTLVLALVGLAAGCCLRRRS